MEKTIALNVRLTLQRTTQQGERKRWKKHQDILKGESSRVMILFRKIHTGLWDIRIIVLYVGESVFFARVAAGTIIRMGGIHV